MGWEERGTAGTRYFYECRRDELGQVRKRYLGAGVLAHQTAARLADEKAARQAGRQEQQSISATIALEKRLESLVTLLFEAVLLSEGFWRGRNYGSWRKRNGIE